MAFPALFVSHGAPSAALEDDAYTKALGAWARGRPRPQAIVVVSAHAEARGPVRVNAGAQPSLIYDFYGFPAPLYDLLAGAFAEAGLDPVLDAQRGWDHGVWVPLRLLYPAADSEHFDPLFFVLGVRDGRDEVESVYEGFRYGTLSLRSFALAAP
jgi:4,5-DOPA dioxygenase extradiol